MTLMFFRAIEIIWRTWKYGNDMDDPEEILAAEAEATGLTLEEIKASHEEIARADASGAAPGRPTHDPKEDGR
jgi:hypothetical protein